MKKIIFSVLLAMAFFCSCDKENGNIAADNKTEDATDVYFVRYSTDRVVGDLTYTDESGKTVQVNSFSGAFERTVGPVEIGFHASISLPSSNVPVQTCIEVKKNDQPFLVRAEGDRRASYVVGSKKE